MDRSSQEKCLFCGDDVGYTATVQLATFKAYGVADIPGGFKCYICDQCRTTVTPEPKVLCGSPRDGDTHAAEWWGPEDDETKQFVFWHGKKYSYVTFWEDLQKARREQKDKLQSQKQLIVNRLNFLASLYPNGTECEGIDAGELGSFQEKVAESGLLGAPLSAGQLMQRYAELRRPVVHGLLRQGETMNVIAPPKLGKSWLVIDMALSIATGRAFLGTYSVEPGRVLILDNELHGETSAARIPQVAAARGIPTEEFADSIHVKNLRGELGDIYSLRSYFSNVPRGYYKLIILDALYRFLPADMEENDNAGMAAIYNFIDSQASRLESCF